MRCRDYNKARAFGVFQMSLTVAYMFLKILAKETSLPISSRS